MAFLHGKNTKMLVGGYDLSAYFSKTGWKGAVAALDVTTFGKGAKVVIPGLADATMSSEGFYDPATTGVDAILASIISQTDVVCTMFPQVDTIGNPGYGLIGVETSYEISDAVTDAVSVSLEVQSSVGMERIIALHALGIEVGTVTGASVDNAASSAAGADLYLVTTAAVALTSAQVLIEHSVDNSTFTTLGTFAAVTAAPNAQRISVAGTVNRYTRARLSALTGTSVTFQAAIGRN